MYYDGMLIFYTHVAFFNTFRFFEKEKWVYMAKNEIKTRIIYFWMKKSVFKESMSSVNKIIQFESFQASKLNKEHDRV